jgi:hypothetical protein
MQGVAAQEAGEVERMYQLLAESAGMEEVETISKKKVK